MFRLVLFKLKVNDIVKETSDTITLIFDKPKDLDYFPGQFLTIDTRQFKELDKIEIGRKQGPRAYSFMSSPTENFLAITIKAEEGGRFSPWMLEGGIRINDEIEIRAPFGSFIYEKTPENIVLISAGSGIVPLRSILKYIIDSKLRISAKLFFSNKTEKDIIYRKELDEFNKLNNIKIIHNLTRQEWAGKSGRIDEEHLKKHVENFQENIFFLCGPNEFCNTVREILIKNQVPTGRIKMEKYG